MNMLKNTGASVLCDCLEQQGVKVVFGIPGGHNLYLFEALRRSKIRVVATTHEQSAGFMANGYSRVTGETGVFLTIPGPGFTNAFTSIAESLVDSVPIVGILTGVRNDINWAFQMHEIRQVELAKPITKGVLTARKADEIFEKMKKVFKMAESGEPGPALLEVPSNVLSERVSLDRGVKCGKKQNFECKDVEKDIEQVLGFVRRSKRIGMFIGQGAANAAKEVRAIAEWLMAPVATTLSGRGCLPENHQLSLGFGWGNGGIEAINRILNTYDLILAIGVKFSEIGTNSYRLRFDVPLIHVDASNGVLGKNYSPALALQMDAQEFLNKLLAVKAQLGPRDDKEILEAIDRQKVMQMSLSDEETRDRVTFSLGNHSCSPHYFFKTLREVLPNNAILVTDSGHHQIWARRNFRVLAPRTLIIPSDYQSMGYAIPSAIGSAIALPHRKVVAVVGDGGFAMSGFEFMTGLREDVDLVIVLFNDGYFGYIKEIQEANFGATCGVDLVPPNFNELAKSFHMHYQVPNGGIKETLRDCIQRRGLTLLEVKVHRRGKSLVSRMTRCWKRKLKSM